MGILLPGFLTKPNTGQWADRSRASGGEDDAGGARLLQVDVPAGEERRSKERAAEIHASIA
jgi:hypothetical protein